MFFYINKYKLEQLHIGINLKKYIGLFFFPLLLHEQVHIHKITLILWKILVKNT